MATIQWRPEINALTTPQSYRILAVPRNSASIEDIAADIALHHPNFNEADILTVLRAEDEAIRVRLLNGEQVTKEGSFSWYLAFTGRLDEPDDPLPSPDESLHIHVRVSPPFVEAVRRSARTERLPLVKKLPLISLAEDTLLTLDNVLNPNGALRLTGGGLRFDPKQDGNECVLEGTRNGRAGQTRLVKIEDSEVIVLPEVPVQNNPWNNEYTVSISTRYSEHGSLRTGTCARRLRTPLEVAGFGGETGILTGRANSPLVSIIGGTAGTDETLRIQVVFAAADDLLLFNLIDMREDGEAGPEVTVAAEGEYTLSGFAGSAVSSLSIRVDRYSALKDILRNDYAGRLADILEIRTA